MIPRLAPVAQETLTSVHPQAARSVFWELGDLDAGDPLLEKEAWLTTVLLTFGTCGFNLDAGSGLRGRARATVLFCPPADAAGCARMPSGPVTADALVLTSLFVDPDLTVGASHVLVDAALAELTARRTRVVEAFGYRDGVECSTLPGSLVGLVADPQAVGLLPAELLAATGFEVVAEHPVFPRFRLELPPPNGLLSAAEAEELLAPA